MDRAFPIRLSGRVVYCHSDLSGNEHVLVSVAAASQVEIAVALSELDTLSLGWF